MQGIISPPTKSWQFAGSLAMYAPARAGRDSGVWVKAEHVCVLSISAASEAGPAMELRSHSRALLMETPLQKSGFAFALLPAAKGPQGSCAVVVSVNGTLFAFSCNGNHAAFELAAVLRAVLKGDSLGYGEGPPDQALVDVEGACFDSLLQSELQKILANPIEAGTEWWGSDFLRQVDDMEKALDLGDDNSL